MTTKYEVFIENIILTDLYGREFVPTEGMVCSQPGNDSFPAWECFCACLKQETDFEENDFS